MFKTITRAVVLTAVAGGLQLTLAVPANAYPTPPADGRRCSFASVTDPTIEGGEVQTGQINGGPLVATIPGATISMRCTIQVGGANATHNGADSCSVASAPTLQVTAVPPTLCSYLSPEGQPVYMCTEVTINGVTYYWDSSIPNPPFTNGMWTTSSAAGCDLAISQEIFPGPFEPVIRATDEVICSVFEMAWDGNPNLDRHPFRYGPTFGNDDPPPGGYNDLYFDFNNDGQVTNDELFWDCPPYV